MSRNGSGTYNLPAGNPVVTGTTISSSWANNTLTDIATALTGSVAADGQTPMTGNLDVNSNRVINVSTGIGPNDAVNLTQFQTPTFTGAVVAQSTLSVAGNVSLTSTGFILIPAGTTAQRPVSPSNGYVRYNSTLNQFEGYAGGAWGSIGGGATGGGGDQVFVENGVTVTTSYTLSTNKNAESVGPISINSSAVVTIPSGQRWVIL